MTRLSCQPRASPFRRLVHILFCRDGSLHTGITYDIPKRLKAHVAGQASRCTRSRLPMKLANES